MTSAALRPHGFDEGIGDSTFAALEQEWDRLRNAAWTNADRAEIDAIFARVMP